MSSHEVHSEVPRAMMSPAEADAYRRRLLDALGDRDPLEVMAELPTVLRQLTADLSGEALHRPEAPGKWSVMQVLEHLADHEIINGFRLRSSIAEDAPTLRGYDQLRWVERLHYGEADAATVLHEIEVARARTLRLLRALDDAELDRVGMHAERGPESVRANIAITAGHDMVHRRQIVRIRDAVLRTA